VLPRRIPKKPKRATRWRSQAHCNFVRGFRCAVVGCENQNTEVAHVRLGSGTGIGQKPDDWRTVPLCGGIEGHHARQHRVGETTFWQAYEVMTGETVEDLIAALCKASPKAREIAAVKAERANGA
jgi:hypothetical protein